MHHPPTSCLFSTRRRVLDVALPVLLLLAFSVGGGAAASADTVLLSMGLDPARRAGTGPNGDMQLYAPDPVQAGSSISHWDVSALPNLLMEPNINPDLPIGGLDITPDLMRALGWRTDGGAPIQILYTDAAGQGFDDPTLGSQRRAAIEQATAIWSARLSSAVPIKIDVAFDSLPCTAEGGATLAQAGPTFVFTDTPGATPSTWYPAALAEALAGFELNEDPGAEEIRMRFNSEVDEGCLGEGTGFYYGLDGQAPATQIAFLNVTIHELGHGLGFTSFVDEETGEKFLPERAAIDIFSSFIRDLTTGKKWQNSTAAQIRRSAANTGNLIFESRTVRTAAAKTLELGSFVSVDMPSSFAGELRFGVAEFGPPLNTVNLGGELVRARPALACTPLQRQDLNGRIVLIDRGDCTFVEKVKNAQDAGALAVIVANNTPDGLINMAGDDDSVRIPAVFVSQADGARLDEALAAEPGTDPGEPGEDGLLDAPTDPCSPGEETVCLRDGRFEVTAAFELQNGSQGSMGGLNVTDDTAALYFLNPANVEVFVKILDACSSTEPRFWVFAAGLTNQKVELRIRDTLAGKARVFENPLQTTFVTVTGTTDELGAFPTCP